MKNSSVEKALAVGIILLFVGIAVAPSINQSVVKASQDDDLVEVTTQACGIKGYGNTTVTLSHSLGSLSSPSWKWSISGGGTQYDDGSNIAVDFMGNTYVTGIFMGTATFGGTTLTSKGDADVFVAKIK